MIKNRTRDTLTVDELVLLDGDGAKIEGILPTAKRWMLEYAFGSGPFGHGMQIVEYWDAQAEPDICARYQEWVAAKEARSSNI